MTSVSSAVTMTAFESVPICNKCKHVSCVDCSSATSTHSSAVILKQVSSQVTYNALPCSISLYRWSFHSPTKNLMRPVLLKELHMHFLYCCTFSRCVSLPDICTEGLFLHLGFRICNGRLAAYVKDNLNPTTLSIHIQYHGQDRLYQLCTCFVVAVHPLYQTHPLNDTD